jgi:hypothetical protein
MVLHATAAENEAQEFRRGMIDECEQMGQLGLYACEANTNNAGDLNWNVMEKVNRQMEWMRTELGVNWAMEVRELRLGTAGDLNSMARQREGQRMAMKAGEHRENCGGGDNPKRQRGVLQHHPNCAS